MSTSPPTIDPFDAGLLSTAEASKKLCEHGYKASPTTVWAWITKGRRGVHLPAIRFGTGFKTSDAALRWFLLEVDRRAREHQEVAHAD